MTLNSETTGNAPKSQMLVEKNIEEIETKKTNGSVWLEKKTFRVALIGIFTAVTIVLGYLLVEIPNIEVFTMMIFLSGFIMSKKEGAIIGLLSAAIFTFFNPFSPSPPLLFVYQLFHYSMTGVLGGFTRDFLRNKEFFKPTEDLYIFRIIFLFGLLGAIITLIFDIITNLIGLLVGFPINILTVLFAAVHLLGNTLVFVFLLPGLIQLIMKLLD